MYLRMQPENLVNPEFFRRPGHLINRAARGMQRIAEAQLKPLGFSTGQLPVLGALRDGKKLSQKDLAAIARIEQPTMAQILGRMKRDGLISVEPDPADKRGTLVSLAPLAYAGFPAVMKVLTEGNRRVLQGFSDDETATLVSLLDRLISNLEQIES